MPQKKLLRAIVLLCTAVFLQSCSAVKTAEVKDHEFEFPSHQAYLHYSRGIVYSQNWMYQEAVDEYKKALEFDKDSLVLNEKLAEELVLAAKNEGSAIKKKLDTHRMADANKAFAHFAW